MVTGRICVNPAGNGGRRIRGISAAKRFLSAATQYGIHKVAVNYRQVQAAEPFQYARESCAKVYHIEPSSGRQNAGRRRQAGRFQVAETRNGEQTSRQNGERWQAGSDLFEMHPFQKRQAVQVERYINDPGRFSPTNKTPGNLICTGRQAKRR